MYYNCLSLNVLLIILWAQVEHTFNGWSAGTYSQPGNFSEENVGMATTRWASTAIAKLMSKPHRFMDLIHKAEDFLKPRKKNSQGAFQAGQNEYALICD